MRGGGAVQGGACTWCEEKAAWPRPAHADSMPHEWPGNVDLSCLYGSQSDWHNSTVVVPAVYKEWHYRGPPTYLQEQYPVYLYQRHNESARCYCANRGYESAVYLTFIARHYSRLPAFVAFVQGDWVFATKTNAGGPFRLWQPHCVAPAAAAGLPWAEYMPLGGRRTAWPPRCVARKTDWYNRFTKMRGSGPVVEACARELLRVVEWKGFVRPYEAERPLNITFYTNMNFLASRQRLKRYAHRVYTTLAKRFVEDGVCVPSGSRGEWMRGSGGSDSRAGDGTTIGPPVPVDDKIDFAKWTLGMATEFLQQAIFGDSPLEDGPAPMVPLDEQHCTEAARTTCSIGS